MCSSVNISTPPFHLNLSGRKGFKSVLPKDFSFFQPLMCLKLLKKPNHQFHRDHQDNSERDLVFGFPT